MTRPEPSFSIRVEVTNPGQFFACCGLLELAHRLWPGAEGWFDMTANRFRVATVPGGGQLAQVIDALCSCPITGLEEQERNERDELEARKRELKKQRKELPATEEKRRKELGERARVGPVLLEGKFGLVLDWWQSEDEIVPKTWAGLQELHKIARAAQDTFNEVVEFPNLLDFGQVLRMPLEYRATAADASKTVEPFCFDARRFVHALNTGFSLDVQNAETTAHPFVELLCLIGLQRFRPSPVASSRSFDYWTWSTPFGVSVAPTVVTGAVAIGERCGYRFPLRFRDSQKRYKAFGYATPTGGRND